MINRHYRNDSNIQLNIHSMIKLKSPNYLPQLMIEVVKLDYTIMR